MNELTANGAGASPETPDRRAEKSVISVAVPVYNEEAVLPELLRRLRGVLDTLPGGPHEMVFADDGSRDATAALLRAEAGSDARVRVVELSRNFGHQIALTAALDHCRGDAIVMMDGDLQDAPELIPEFVRRWLAGADVIYAVRSRRAEGWLLRTCYHLFYRLIEQAADLKLPRDSGDFCLVSAEAAAAMRGARERNRYVRGLRTWVGFRQEAFPVERQARQAGASKYGWRRLFGLAFDGIFSFSTAPIRLAVWMGAATVVLTALLGLFWIIGWSAGAAPQGFTALAISIAFFGGVQLVFLGLIGEYVGRIYDEVKQRPLYIIRRTPTDLMDETVRESAPAMQPE
jgi:glycosyltransferase involved in cell wall biosynthesis